MQVRTLMKLWSLILLLVYKCAFLKYRDFLLLATCIQPLLSKEKFTCSGMPDSHYLGPHLTKHFHRCLYSDKMSTNASHIPIPVVGSPWGLPSIHKEVASVQLLGRRKTVSVRFGTRNCPLRFQIQPCFEGISLIALGALPHP